eukprot:7094534-Pyramimonas_sp.AAC.1
MPINWTIRVGRILPSRPADITISLAEGQIGILSRSRFFKLTMSNTSESTSKPDCILLSPGRHGQPCTNCLPLFSLKSSARHDSPML